MVKEKTLAEKIGLKHGDSFTEINGQPVKYYDEVSGLVKPYTGDTISFKIQRDGQLLAFKEYYKGQTGIGFYAVNMIPKEGLISVHYSFGQAIWLGPGRAFNVILVQLKAFRKIFGGDISLKKSLSGPIGIAKAYGGTWDWENFWRMTRASLHGARLHEFPANPCTRWRLCDVFAL